LRAALAALALLGAGCEQYFDPCFATAQQVKDLRVLALRADPPEAVFDPGGGGVPEVVVTALVVDPAGDPDDVLAVARFCPSTDDRRCPPDAPAVGVIESVRGVFRFTVRATHAMLAAALDADPLRGYGGIRLQVDLELAASFGRRLSATKLLLYSPAAPGYVPNHGLEIVGLHLLRGGLPAGDAGPGTSLELIAGEWLGIIPELAPGDGASMPAEEFEVVDLSGKRARLREHLSYSLYSTPHGRFTADTADQPPDGTTPSFAGLVRFMPTQQARGTFYVVVRDGRGAVAWLSLDWGAVEPNEGRQPNRELGCE